MKIKKVLSYILIFSLIMSATLSGITGVGNVSKVSAESIAPSAEQILSDYKNFGSSGKHPRLLLNEVHVKKLKEEMKDTSCDKYFWYNKIKIRADIICTELNGSKKADYIPVYSKKNKARMKHSKSNGTTSNSADEFRYEMMVLGMMYLLSDGEAKGTYSEAAWDIIQEVNKFDDINPWHDLDFGFFCQGYAIAYDWMYSAWDEDQKTALREGIVKYCFTIAARSYKDNSSSGYPNIDKATVMGVKVDHNHNAIVNSGIAMASLAFMDDYPETASSLCSEAISCLDIVLDTYAPSGLNNEGTQYWLLTIDDLSMLFSSLEYTTGDLYGLDTCPGLSNGKTMRALHAIESDVGMFSFGDTFDSFLTSAGELYFDKHYNLHGFRKKIHDRIKKTDDYARVTQVLCWYEPDEADQGVNIDRDWVTEGKGAYATFRNHFDKEQSFVGVKAGQTLKEYFMHLDEGSFVYHSQGVKWAIDMGSDNYDVTGYSDVNNARWNVFRLRPDGHNTLLIDPTPSEVGYEFDKTAYLSTDSSDNQAKAVIDMSELVSSKASSYKRGFLLTDNRTSLVVRDEVSLKQKSKLYWIMYTEQAVEINGNTAVLKAENGKILKLGFASSQSGVLYLDENAAPWALAPEVPVSSNNVEQNKNGSYNRIVYMIDGAEGDVSITAKFIPEIEALKDAKGASAYTDIASWDVKKENILEEKTSEEKEETDPDKKEETDSDKDKEKESDKKEETTSDKNKETDKSETDDKTTTKQDETTQTDDKTTSTDKDKEAAEEYIDIENISPDKLKKNMLIKDKKSGGMYKITKITRKKGKITGGNVTYMKPCSTKIKKAKVKTYIKLCGAKFYVTAINKNAFRNCKKLRKITLGSRIKKIGKNAFKGIYKKATFKVPKKKLKKYKKMIKKAKAPKKSKITHK